VSLRRLFSTFADGWPGVGLLLIRLAVGSVLVAQALSILRSRPAFEQAALEIVAMAGGVLLIAGLWTPVAGSAIALLEAWNLIALSGDPWTSIVRGTVGAALALLGPGAWSVDARLFGWKRIDIRDRRDQNGS
jgi:putative oxidoreductase